MYSATLSAYVSSIVDFVRVADTRMNDSSSSGAMVRNVSRAASVMTTTLRTLGVKNAEGDLDDDGADSRGEQHQCGCREESRLVHGAPHRVRCEVEGRSGDDAQQ